jgi:predicted O-methyltransferase YrrM
MITKRIQNVLSKLQEQSEYEDEYEQTIPHSERMLAIRKDTGMFYNILLKSINAKNILEIGTSFGFSTLWFADALLSKNKIDDCSIITIDNESFKLQMAQKNFEEAGVNQIIKIKEGNAKNVLSELLTDSKNKNFFDFVFIDADKENYIEYFDLCFPMVRKEGIIGADNILFPEKFNSLMNEYVSHVRNHPNTQSVTIPIDNGEEITIKT